ncbi:MAG: DUF192 domain-containing protein [Weeksellaceae bacterium]
MKKQIRTIIIAVIVLLIVFVGYSIFQTYRQLRPQDALWENYQVKSFTIEGQTYDLIVADTDERAQKGLMFVREPLSGADGMIFTFDDLEKRTFWNMNTFLPLDILWIQDNRVIGKSELPSIKQTETPVTVSSPDVADTVVELFK